MINITLVDSMGKRSKVIGSGISKRVTIFVGVYRGRRIKKVESTTEPPPIKKVRLRRRGR